MYGNAQHGDTTPSVQNNESTVLIGEFMPSNEPIDFIGESFGGNLMVNAMKPRWPSLPTAEKAKLPAPGGSAGLEVITEPEKFCDPTNSKKQWQDLETAVKYADDTAAGDGKRMADEVRGTTEPDAVRGKMRDFTRKHPTFAVVFETNSPSVAVANKELLDVFASLSQDATNGELVTTTREKLKQTTEQIQAGGKSLRGDLEGYVEALTGLSVFQANGGTVGRVYLINTRSVAELLAVHRPALKDWLAKTNQLGFCDIAFLNAVPNHTQVRDLGLELDADRRCCIWATLGGVRSEEHALDLASRNPTVGTTGAGNVNIHVGTVTHRKLVTTPTAALIGLRNALDRRFTGYDAGPMTHLFGPRSSRALVGLDSVSTATWSRNSLKRMATLGGLNAVIKQDSGIFSPYLARTQSNLDGYQSSDGSRFGSMLTERVLSELDLTLPSLPNVPAIRRAAIEAADRRHLEPFRAYAGFAATLSSLVTKNATTANLAIDLENAEPIEEIALTRRQLKRTY